jgi:HSP20 family protein
MSYLIPRGALSFPSLMNSFLDDDWGSMSSMPNGLSIAEDDKHVYVEAAIPGVNADDVDMSFEKGILRIVAESKKEEREGKKYFRKASSSFSYQVAVPGEVDLSIEPEAEVRDGIVHITFTKAAKAQPKKISIKKK